MSSRLPSQKNQEKQTRLKHGSTSNKFYFGTIRNEGIPVDRKSILVEPDSGLTPEFAPGRGIAQHKDCGGCTLVRLDEGNAGKPFFYVCAHCMCQVFEPCVQIQDLPANDFEMFGDESVAGDYVLYGILVLNRNNVDNAADEVQELLDYESGVSSARFHCKEVFHDGTRRNTDWSKLNQNQLWQIAVEVIKAIKGNGCMFCLGVVHKNSFPAEIPGRRGTKLSFDHLYPLAFSAAVTSLEEHGLLNCEIKRHITIDHQKTKVTFWGVGKAQVQRLLHDKRIPVTVANGNGKPILLDAVDIALYAIGQCLKGKERKEARRIMQLIAPQRRDARWEPNCAERPYKMDLQNGIPILYSIS